MSWTLSFMLSLPGICNHATPPPVDCNFLLFTPRRMKPIYYPAPSHSIARLHEIMTAPPMPKDVHCAIQRRRAEARRRVEDAREARALGLR